MTEGCGAQNGKGNEHCVNDCLEVFKQMVKMRVKYFKGEKRNG